MSEDVDFKGDNESKTNLIINYLPQSMTDEEFNQLFASVGPVTSAKIVRNKANNYSYGFGFVDYTTPVDAERAIQTLNGLQIQNKRIKVALARPRSNEIKRANLYVKNIPVTMTEADIEKMFEPYGNIVQCRLLKTPQGTSKGVAFILFELHEQAEEAMQRLHNKVLPNSTAPLDIKFATDNQKSGSRQGQPQQGGAYNPKQNFAYGQYGMQPAYYDDPTSAFGGPMKHRSAHRFNPLNSAAGHGMDIFQAGGYNAYSTGYANPGMVSVRPPPRGVPDMPGNGTLNRPQAAGHTLFVYNIGLATEEPDMRNLFANYGVISKINVIKKSNGYAFVTFDDRQQAEDAIKSLHGFSFNGNLLQVSFKK